ncbi:MAG TPA: hypothetical protein VML35_06310, partial [Gaiellaceae bacterium]|nr:hypothetical protein [Gaiellaceae bacterium]
MRQRAIGLVIAGIGLFGLLTMYVSPIVVALRLPAAAEAATPLPSLRVPALPFPTLAEPAIAAPAAAASARKAVTAPAAPQQQQPSAGAPAPTPAPATAPAQAAAAAAAPVVTNEYTLTPEAAAPTPAAAAEDPFVGVPVVDDSIGTIPVTTAAPPGAAAAPAAAPPAAADAATAEPAAAAATPAEELAELEAARAAQPAGEPASVTYSEPETAEEAATVPIEEPVAAETEIAAESEPQIEAPDSTVVEQPVVEAPEAAAAVEEPAAVEAPETVEAPAAVEAPEAVEVAAPAASEEIVLVDVPAPDEADEVSVTSSPEPAQEDGDAATAAEAPTGPQIVYLDADGASGVTYEGPITVTGIDVPAYTAPARFAGQEAAILAAVAALVEQKLAAHDVVVTLERPADGVAYSTVYLGGTSAPFSEYGRFFGLAETVDVGNAIPDDNAFVFTDEIQVWERTVDEYAKTLADFVAHEVGHLLGFAPVRTARAGDASDVLADYAFKPYTHVEIAKDVRNDLIEDGKLDITGYRADGSPFVTEYTVHPRVLDALVKYPGHYYAGTVGPDGFPDVTFGQRIIHPNDTGTWLARVFDMAWAAQIDPAFTDDERLQILAFAYGYATHAAGDFFAHTLVNEFTEGVFPAVFDIVAGETKERDAANAIRHLLLETYIGDATPGLDGNGDRNLLPSGDLSGDSTPGIEYDAPMRYIYSALVAPFPGDPTSPADTGTGQSITANAAANTFTRATGSFLADNFQVGMQFFTFGFTNAANPTKYTIAAVTDTVITVNQDILFDEAGTGDEALVVRGDRGPLLDAFYIIQRLVDDAALALGPAPAKTLEQLLAEIVPLLTDGDPGTNPDALTTDDFVQAYLIRWSQAIDEGAAEWGRFGLATTKALFDAETRRYWENELAGNDGTDPNRADGEAGVGLIDLVLAELDDPNRDGNLDDSFLTHRILPMLGLPTFVGELRASMVEFIDLLDELVLAPIDFIFAPLSALLGLAKQVVKDFAISAIEHFSGIDFELIEQLEHMNSKMDLASVTIDGVVIPIYKDSDRDKLDEYMGINGTAHSHAFGGSVDLGNADWAVSFYADAVGALKDNVEFDKERFRAYANSVTLSKMLLLQETNPLGAATTGSGQLSALMSNFLTELNGGTATTYDWGLLNQVGAHGGNIFTTTLPKPAVEAALDPTALVGNQATLVSGHGLTNLDVVRYSTDGTPIGGLVDGGGYFVTVAGDLATFYLTFEDAKTGRNAVTLTAPSTGSHTLRTAVLADVSGLGSSGILLDIFRVARDSDQRPWLRLIDGDGVWRADNMTTTYALFVVHAPGTGGDYVEWEAELGAGTYDVQASWLWNVTRRIDNPLTLDVNPAVSELASIEERIAFQNTFGFKLDFKIDGAHLDPTANATYLVFDHLLNPLPVSGPFVADQRLFNVQHYDELLRLHFDSLGTLTLGATTIVKVRLFERADGYVVAGPLRFVKSDDDSITRIYRIVDPQTLAEDPLDGFTVVDEGPNPETGCYACGTPDEITAPNGVDTGWHNLAYDTGTGNFPLWESDVLRPVFRTLFRDWQNGTENFPDLGDAPSPDPNTDPSVTAVADPPGPYLTPFVPQPSLPVAAPAGALDVVVTGTQTLNYVGTTVLGSLTGDGDLTPDEITIVVTAAATGAGTFAVDLIGNAFTRMTGSFLTDGFAAGQEVIAKGFSLNNGRYTVASVSLDGLSLVIVEALLFGDTTGSGDESITSPGKLVFAGPGLFGGGGLSLIRAQADEIALLPGVTVSVRVIAGGDPRSAPSSGNSGAVELSAGTISLGRQAAIVAHADGGFTAGDVSLIASKTGDTSFDFFHLEGPTASVELGPSALVTGANVLLSATATTAAPASLGDVVNDLFQVLPAGIGFFTALALIAANLDLIPQTVKDAFQVIADALESVEDALRTAIGNDGVFSLPSGVAAAATFARSDARVDAASGARIESSGNADLRAHAVSTVASTVTAAESYLGLNYASSAPTALVRLGMGATLVAGGSAELRATTATTLTMRTEVTSAETAVGITSSFGKTDAKSRAEVAAGAAVTTTGNLTLFAENTRAIENKAIGGGFVDSGTAGVGAVLAVGYHQSLAEAVLAGAVTAVDVAVTARSLETKNDTQSFGSVSAQPGTASGIESGADQAAGNLDTTTNAGGRNVDATGGDDLTIGAAMTLLESENRAASWLDDGARITAQNVTLTSLAEIRPRATAVAATTGSPSGTAIGGAVVWAKYANQATSFVGYNAVVDAAQALTMNATATMFAPYAAYDPALSLAGLGDTYADANTAADGAADALAGLATYLAGPLADTALIGTAYAHAATGTGTDTALSGGVNYLELYSLAAVGIAPGARVTAEDVIGNAVSTLEAVAVAGLESALSLPAGGSPGAADTAGGGYFGGVFAETYARAYVDDRATVTTTRDLTLDALTHTKLLNVAKQGATGDGLTIEGVFALVVLDQESLAFVEDRATVAAGRDLELTADNKNLIVNVAGAQALGGTDAVGIAIAATVIGTPDDFLGSPEVLEDRAEAGETGASVRAFLGDAVEEVGTTPTGGIVGSVTAGRHLKLTATSDPAANEIWTAAVAGAGSATTPAGSADLSAPGDSANNLDVSAAGGAAINVIERRTLAYVRDLDAVSAGGELRLEALDATLMLASAGATIGTGNDTIGASFALNVTDTTAHAFTRHVDLTVADVSLIATSNLTLLAFETTALTGGGSGLTIAASFSVTFADPHAEAGFGEATTLAVTGNVLIQATSLLDVIAVAGTAAFEAGEGFGVGAALTLVILDSSALAYPGIDLDTAGSVTISASSDLRSRAFSAVNGSTTTSSATTAPGAQAVVAILTSDADASITDVSVTAGGAVTVSAVSKLRSAAEAIGDSSHSDGAKDAAIATSFATSEAIAQVSGDAPVTAGGALTISADNEGRVTTTGNAGTAQAGAGIAIALVTLTTKAFLNSTAPVSAASMLLSADTESAVATTGSASQGGSTANDESPSDRTENNAQTSDGSIAVAGALAFTKLDAPTEAFIASPATATGEVKLHARGVHSSGAVANASAAAGSPGIGIAIAIALSNVSAKAYVGSTSVGAGSLVVEALNESGATYTVTATSGTSPSSATVIAGGLALHVLTSETSALLLAGSTVTLTGGDATFTATSASSSTVKATPAGPTSGGGLGIGASVALNIVDDDTTAGLAAGSDLVGAGNLTLAATSTDAMVTEAEAGASGGTAIVPAVAISISSVSTTALLGAGSALTLTGDFSATASQSATVTTTAKGTAASTGTGIGVAFALTYATHVATATPARDVTAGGNVTLTARSYSSTSSSATASASGAPDTASGDVDSQVAGQQGFANSTAAANGASGSTTPAAPSAATSGGSVSIAAAVAVNLVTSSATASIPELLSLTATGALSLVAAAETDAAAAADASATSGGSANVGAAVAINLANHTAEATIGAEADVSALGVSLAASTGGPAGSAADNTNTFGATATSGAGGGSVGVAGSLALNVANLETLALIRHNPARGPPTVDANGSAVSLSATSSSSSTATAQPKTAAGGSSLGIGASVALNLVDDLADAGLEQGAVLSNAGAVTLSASATHAMTTEAKAGATGAGVSIAPAVAIAISNVRAFATFDAGPSTLLGSLSAAASTTASALTKAEGASAGSVSIGVALALTLADHKAESWSARSLTVAGAVSFSATAVSSTFSDALAGASGA